MVELAVNIHVLDKQSSLAPPTNHIQLLNTDIYALNNVACIPN